MSIASGQSTFAMLTVTLHYSPDLVRMSVFAYLRRGFGTSGFIAFAVLFAAAILFALTDPGSWLAGVASGVVAVIILLFFGLYFLHYRHGMAKLARMQQPQAVLQLTDLELTASSQAGSFSAPWSTFTDLWRFSDFWLLILGRGKFMTLPLADLTEEAQSFIESHIGQRRQPATDSQ